MRIVAFIAILAMGFMLLYSTSGLPELFDPDSPASTHVSARYIEKSVEETGSVNFVNAVSTGYRVYDALGKVAVIFTAGLAAALIVRPYSRKGKK